MGTRGFDYDSVIIGSGMGGLITGAYLVKKGIKVLICEQHTQPGGYFTSFTRQGYTFNGGIQACEDCGMLFAVLKQIGVMDRMEFDRTLFALATPDHFTAFRSMEDVFQFYRNLIEVYPGEAEGINQIIKDIDTFCGVMDAYCQIPNPMFGPLKDLVRRYPGWKKEYRDRLRFSKDFFRHLEIPLDDYLKDKLGDPDLIRFIKQMMYVGSPAAFALIFHYFVMDYYLPKGGFQVMSDVLADFITERGGEIRYRTMVEEIVLERGRASGVRLRGGDVVRAPYIISNSDARRTFLQMLPPEATTEPFKLKLRDTPVSDSVVTVFLGVDIPAEDIPTQGCSHVYYMSDYKGVDIARSFSDEDYYHRAPVEICIPSLHDPALAPPGKSAVILQALTFMGYGGNWGTENGKRGEAYQRIKEKVANQLIDNAEKVIPGLREKIEVKFAATPVTNERYTLNSEGATAGWTYDPSRAFNSGMKGIWGYRTPVKHLFLVGHWTMSPGGAPACFMSGRIVSSIINWRLKMRI